MHAVRVILGVGLSLVAAKSVPGEQQPLGGALEFDLIRELKIAEIIPTVFDEFKPFLTLNVTWNKAAAQVGNTIKVKKLQKIPKVEFLGHLPGLQASNQVPQLTLALTDPDARSRDNPDWSQMCHWLITNVSLTDTSGEFVEDGLKHAHEIVSYQPPGPPKKTGKHRYVFAALAPRNGTSAKLHLSTPKDRQHWGYGTVRAGLREWAEENGLEVAGANFIYAQDKKQ
ncbi:putative phosphatidylethanolamine-binding protein [Septoria linicola]|nr:putative phosphatidylethanolamine-binding protein [Septoria linicola]